ncbi:MAG TPA: class I SAM-dependent methyltransferase [Candidatus Aminicenantes bacterium]|nr:class I SAM-dependent methyltransferase [Candidatus Aminicenantes bacterium]
MTRWYEELFLDYADHYDHEPYTQGTAGECDFIEKEIGGDKKKRILDIGCGTGRHAIELARRGYRVVGVDLSAAQLRRAREKAAAAGVSIDFRRCDARELPFTAEFDLAIMLCEGAFPLMETDEMNYAILRGAARALKPGGQLIFTTLNGLFPLFHSVKEFLDREKGEGGAECRESSFDLMTFRDRNVTSVVDDSGNKKELRCDERYYVPSEIAWLLKSLGFRGIGIFAARLGAFSRADALTPDEFEMLVVAEKE